MLNIVAYICLYYTYISVVAPLVRKALIHKVCGIWILRSGVATMHRVDRVTGFFYSRPNWLPPPLIRERVLIPPFGSRGGILPCG